MSELMAGFLILASVGAMWMLVLWIGGAFLAAWVATEKGRDPVAWWVLGFLLSPLLALVALSAVAPRTSEAEARSFEAASLSTRPSPFRPATFPEPYPEPSKERVAL